jgi:hypothetical protein
VTGPPGPLHGPNQVITPPTLLKKYSCPVEVLIQCGPPTAMLVLMSTTSVVGMGCVSTIQIEPDPPLLKYWQR